MVRKVRASEAIGGVTLEQYAKVKARLDVEATRPAPRSLAEILDEVGLDEACWADASARWAERVNDDSAARLRQGWLSKRFPPPIAYGVAYAVAVERELSAFATEVPETPATPDVAGEEGPGGLRDTLPRPGDRIGLPADGDDADAAAAGEPDDGADEAAAEDTAPTTKERARSVPLVDRTPSLADPPRRYRPRDLPASQQATAAPAAALGRLDPDGATIVGGSPLAGEALPFKPAASAPLPRLDPDGDTVTGVSPPAAAPLPFGPAAEGSAEADDPEGTRETIPPAPAAPVLDPEQRLDPDGATVIGAELSDDPPLPFDRGSRRS